MEQKVGGIDKCYLPLEGLFHYGPSGKGYYYADLVIDIYNQIRP
jgi:hypothetical protein